jgi:hypothetical protein
MAAGRDRSSVAQHLRPGALVRALRSSLLLAALLAPPAVRAVEVWGAPVDVGVAAGLLSEARIQLAWHSDFAANETFEITSPATLLLGAFFDVPVHSSFSLGGRINTANVRIDRDINLGHYNFDNSVHVLQAGDVRVVELMLSGKLRVDAAEGLRLLPALYLGFIQAFATDPDARNKGLGLNLALEAQYRPDAKGSLFLFGEVAALTQLYGGVSEIGYVKTKVPAFAFSVGAGF